MPQVRVLLVDNSEAFLEGVKSWLALEPLLELVGTARTGQEAVDEVERLKPDLVLMDVGMPDLSGFEATRRIKSGDDARESVPRATFTPAASIGSKGYRAWPKYPWVRGQ